MRSIFLVVFSFMAIALLAGNEPVDKNRQAKEWLKNQPLAFIENKGQFTNSDGKPADNVLFKASYGDCDIYITTEGISYVFVKYEKAKSKNADTIDIRRKIGEKQKEDKTISYYRLDMNLQGSTINRTQIIKELPGKQGVTNYFYPSCPDGIYGVQEYGKITIKNIYKGIDWVIYTNAENKEAPLKYDFVVQPQANYKDIKIKFINAQITQLADNGTKLKIQTIAGNIEESNLYSYLENSTTKQAIKTNYKANADSTLEFEIGAYDKTKTLVIDPLVWATYYGGSGADKFYAVCTDSEDNIYITGSATSPDFPTQQLTNAYWQSSNNVGYDILILKFNTLGVRQWATFYGGSNSEYSLCIHADKLDNIYITGYTDSPNFPIQQLSSAFYQQNYAGNYDVYILKFNTLGQRKWATFYGGKEMDFARAIGIDSQNNVYLIGETSSPDLPTQNLTGAFNQSNLNWSFDLFILKFNSVGILEWATYYGGNDLDEVPTICIDSYDNVFVTGITNSTNFPTQLLNGAYFQATYAGGAFDAFIIKFDKGGSRLWATYYGGNDIDAIISTDVDSQNNIYLTGETYSTDFPIQELNGAYNQINNAGNCDIFIAQFSNLGINQWATYYGGQNFEVAMSICADNNDNIYITGMTGSNDFPTQQLSGEYWQVNVAGDGDAFILKFNKKMEREWATYYGGKGFDQGEGIIADNSHSVYFIIDMLGIDAYTIDYGNGSYYDNSWNGSEDGFILKLNDCYNQKTTSVQADRNNICKNETGNIILTAIGGIGDTLKWYSDNAGLNYLGKGTPFTLPLPAQTTTYYVRWESLCDTSACDSIVINIFSQTINKISPVICEGDTCKIGTSKYTTSGIYIDLLFTASGCDSIVTTNLVVNPVKLTVKSPPICEGETFTVGTNGYTLTGNYTDVLKTYLGCDSTVVTNLLVNSIKRTPLSPTICQGESFIVGTNVHTTTGIYSDTLSSVLFCDSIVTTNLSVNPAYQPTPSPSICQGETVTVGIHTYSASGIYIDKLSTMFGCDSIITTHLTVKPVERTPWEHSICEGESVTIGTHNYTKTGTYQDTLTSLVYGCDSIITTHLSVNPNVITLPIIKSICEGETFASGTHQYTKAGIYIELLKTYLKCDSIVTINLTVNPLPAVSLGDNKLICQGDSITLSPGPGFISYLWADGSVLSELLVTSPGHYAVTAFNEWCPASDEITINECGNELWFPNAFSPNGDYTNESFNPVILGSLNTYHILIYNRWGQQLYESNDAKIGWDGSFKGSACASGQYVYVATYSMGTEPATQKQRVQRGSVTLLR